MTRTVQASLALAAVLALAGCSPASKPIIEVGSQRVTAQDYERAARGAATQYPGMPDQAKAQFVNDLRRRALLLEYAHRLGLAQTPIATNAARDEERKLLMQALYSRVAPQAQPVSEAEARALHEARKQEARVWMIYASSRPTALAARERLLAGEPFDRVSRSYSLPGALPPDGDMGFIAPGALPMPLDEALRTLAPGVVGGPYEMREGWFLMKVSERRPREQGSFESLRASLEDLARQRKFRAAYSRVYTDMKQDYDVRHVPGGSQLLFRVISPVSPIEPTPEMRGTLLATYRGGAYTLDDALTDLNRADVQRPSYQLLPAVEIWIEAQVMGRVSLIEARRRHLHEEPEVAATLRARGEQGLMEGVYAMAVASTPAPGPELVAMAWERVKPQFAQLEAARVAVLVTPDSALAVRIAREGRGTGSLADVAKGVDPALTVTESALRFPNADPAWGVLQAMHAQLEPGAWFGPERTPAGWRILQLLDKRVSQQSWEQIPEPLRQNITAGAAELARDARFEQFTDSLTAAYQPRVDEQAIARLPWPVKPEEARR